MIFLNKSPDIYKNKNVETFKCCTFCKINVDFYNVEL